jgi:L-seryl-tRNA(Ser) seleniumtransferase
MDIYSRRGIPTVVNAAGPLTRLSGGVMRAEVAAAMAEASAACVDMTDLQAHASETIARLTAAEAALVTSGAAAGLLLGTAACVAGLDRAAMARLPDIFGLKDEVVVVRSQRNSYDHAVRAAGVRLVEVGLPDRHAGAGIRDAEAADIAEAITPRTAAILYVADAAARPLLPEVVVVAERAKVPVLVDAAAQLPPQSNLRRFIAEGADLVAFSGGKAIGGPQASGFLCGRHDLIMSAALQCLDLDVRDELWHPPPSFIDRTRLAGIPRNGIGRSSKVGKEEIVGLLTALELFAAEGDATRHERWLSVVEALFAAVATGNFAKKRLLGTERIDEIPKLEIAFPPGAEDMAIRLVVALGRASPSIHLDPSLCDRGIVIANPIGLRPGEGERVASAISAWLAGAARKFGFVPGSQTGFG